MCEHKYNKEENIRYVNLGVFVKDWKKLEAKTDIADDPNNCCLLCGRDTSTQKNFYYTVGIGDPYLASHKDDYDNALLSAGYMGDYPIGSECVKKVINAGLGDYVHKNSKKFSQ